MNKLSNPIAIGSFDTTRKSELKIQNSAKTWWLNGVALWILTFAFSSLDGVTLYPVFENLFDSNPLLLYFTTFGTAIALNFLPIISARMLLKAKYILQERNFNHFYITIGMFILLYIGICYLRFATREEVIGSISDSISTASGYQIDEEKSLGAMPMVFLQCLTNLITSAIAFYLAYLSENPVKMQIDALSLQIIEKEEYLTALKCALIELNAYNFENVVNSEKEKYQAALDSLAARRDALKIEADIQLETILGDADSTSFITEGQKALFNNIVSEESAN